ncbi:Predicted metal-dependent hydrolase, TIM-barrel fold [Sulfitobacter brevis]|uniref:Predicted metal-dependent hydrolase, TIM-barrel fold n=1 Tax=Sulfitobacter brevis TaxID=74348 RepID=A0A1I2BUU4_9RHOB|nr:amidohydrolase family protein [Sulfitobacter brevis]SFE59872.1 Predicted metal-dependent hydrolase, TIM-barrel fold [Sulfitobacter brevis]
MSVKPASLSVRPVGRRRISDEIAGQLSEMIIGGQLKVGTKLPTEAEFVKKFDAGRSAVREAIAQLREAGLVESRHGVGAFVCSPVAAAGFKIDPQTLSSLEHLRQVLELRMEIEVGGASMAARRRTLDQLTSIKEALGAVKGALEGGDPAMKEQRAFHQHVATATNNPYFRDLMRFLYERIDAGIAEDLASSVLRGDGPQGIKNELHTIYEAIRIGDPDMARRAAWNHLLRTADRLGLRGLQGWEESRMTSLGEVKIPVCTAADLNPQAPRFTPPPGATDCHAHIFGPDAQYPYTPHRTYTPPEASEAQYLHMLSSLSLSRGVIVQPSVYGRDNSCTLDVVRRHPETLRAVVVVDEDISDKELEQMHADGARGVRLNLLFRSGVEVSDVRRIADKIAALGWHLQMLIDVSEFADIRDTLGPLPVETVFDHLGHMPTSAGTNHPGFQEMLSLVADGKSWVKLSGSYRITGQNETPYTDIAPFAREIIRANPERVLWATDWPHPYINVDMPNDGALLNMFDDWAPDAATRDRILAENPARLYGFDTPRS